MRLIGPMRPMSLMSLIALLSLLGLCSCVREPELHLPHRTPSDIEIPVVDLELQTYWNYELEYGIHYDWRAEWIYGWDEEDRRIFGENIGYTEPEVFNLRRYYTSQQPYANHTSVLANSVKGRTFHGEYNWGFWDILVWSDVDPVQDDVQSLNFEPEINYGETVQPSGQSEELELDEPDISLDELEVDEPVYEIPTEENIEDLASMAESGNDSLEEDLEIPELDPELEAALANIAEEPTMEEVAEEASMDTELSLDELSLEEELPLEEAPEELEAEEPAEEELPLEEAPEELEVEALPEEVPAEEPEAVEEAVTEPEEDPLSGLDTSDPNKQLSPDEIAAMFSAAGGDESVENVTEESEGEIVSETEQENSEDEASNIADALAGLDTSDPNKVMSPDEIQALFANL